MTRALFRREALEAGSAQWLGRVQLVQPLSLRLVTVGVVAVALAVALFLSLAHYTRKARVDGVLVPDRGVIRLVPSAAGTVLERRVAEGQTVRAGDVLFVVALERAQLRATAREQVRGSLAERQRSLHEAARRSDDIVAAQLAALQRRLQALDGEQAQLDGELALQQQRLALAEQALARHEALRRQQFISDAQVQSRREETLAVQAQLQALQRQRSALARERAQLEGERQSVPLAARGVRGVIERDLAQLSREAAEEDAERELIVRAPQDGVVSAVLAEPGQAVSPASALASLVPQGSVLQAQLYAPSSAIGFVRPEQAVRLRLEAFPYQKFGHLEGRVVLVSRTPLAGSELQALALAGTTPAARGGEPLFRITVALGDDALARRLLLATGMRLQGDVQLERRRLVEWLFAPVLGAAERL